MRAMTVRFPEETYQRLEQEAKKLGISAGQFVRESTLARIAYIAGRRGDDDYDQALGDAAEDLKGIVPGRKPAADRGPAF